MRRFAIWSVTLTVLSVTLMAAPVIPAFSAGGGGGGGGGPNDEDLMRPRPQYMKPAPTSAPYMKSAPTPAPAPAARSSHRSKKADKQSFLDDPAFKQGYRTAYDTIYDRHDYAAAIDQLKELGHDDYANVANLIGYSYRKLGDYKLSQVWYERALKSDPNHVLTWNYYGFWQIEQGNRDQAEYHLRRIAEICGTDCYEYRSLAAALEQPTGAALVY
jgi:tetratricopeptide (TPR) repeat protein